MKRFIFVLTMTTAFAIPVANAQTTQENSSLSRPSDAELKAVDEYWTEERMKNAKPFDLPTVSDEEYKKLLLMPVPKRTEEKPQVVEPSDGSKSTLAPENEKSAALGQVQRADVSKFPFSSGGKLFFTTPSGDATCSAQYVGSNRVIMTAAHCVMNGETGTWYKNFKFKRGYADGGGQTVTLSWDCMSVKKEWHQSGPNYPYDYAFIYASSDSGGGVLGLKTLVPYDQFWAIGYPSNFENGKYMQKVEGTKGNVSGGTVAMNGNPFGKGASGGSWIGGGNYAIGLNSFYYRESTDPMYSPYFNNTTYELWKSVSDKKCAQ